MQDLHSGTINLKSQISFLKSPIQFLSKRSLVYTLSLNIIQHFVIAVGNDSAAPFLNFKLRLITYVLILYAIAVPTCSKLYPD